MLWTFLILLAVFVAVGWYVHTRGGKPFRWRWWERDE